MPLKIRFRHTSPVLWSIHRGSRGGGVSASVFEDRNLKPPAFQFYPDDFIAGTSHFTDAEVGLYQRLLCAQWSTGSLPDNDEELCSYGKGGTPLARVKAKFEKCPDGRLRNVRMEIERAKQAAYRLTCAEAGRKGGGNPNFQKGKPNPYKRPLSTGDKGRDKGRINTPSPSPSPSPSPVSDPDLLKEAPSASPPVSSEHQAFIKGWAEQFKAQFGSDYQFDRGRDGKAVKELMQMSIARIDVLEIAKKAWARGLKVKSFNCDKASTIHGFRQYFNDIQVEVKHGHTHQQLNKRNIGVAGAGQEDYGAAAKRKVERQMAQAANQHPPQAQGNGT